MSTSFGIDVAKEDSQLHPVFKTDPLELSEFINKKISLNTTEGLVFEGWVYTIDPVTHTWVLMNSTSAGTSEVQLVMNQAVTDVRIVDEVCPEDMQLLLESYGKVEKVEMSASDLAERRDVVCRWFTVNRIPVVRDGDAISLANGVLTIDPPYDEEHCYSSNQIILDRMRTLLGNLPTNGKAEI